MTPDTDGRADRELLELAAKAAGIEGQFALRWDNAPGILSADEDDFWAPLNNDAEALRLAVTLRMNVRLDDSGACVWLSRGQRSHFQYFAESDPCAATRRAIVRAAAEIGRTT